VGGAVSPALPGTPKRLVVLGGGPAGLSAAHFAQEQGFEVTLVERHPWVGGKGASRRGRGYVLDFGPHAYHPRTRAINELVERHAGSDYLLGPVRMELVLSGRTLQYPFRLLEGLRKLPPGLSARIVSGFLGARARLLFGPAPAESFRSWGEAQFGRALYKLCFGDYTERVWGVSADELSVELARRKLPRLSIRTLLAEVLFRRNTMHAHLFGDDFGYHRLGIGSVFEAIAAGIEERGGRILRGQEVTALRLGPDGRIAGVGLNGAGGPSEVPCDGVVSTIPLTRLGELLPGAVRDADSPGEKLEFRSIVLAYAALRRSRFSAAHWTYLVDGRFRFQRISEQKNLSAACCPEGRTMLTLETSELSGPAGEPELRRDVKEDLGFFGVRGDEIESLESFHLADAYPIYRTGYAPVLARALERLGPIGNLVSTGRQGLFLDIDMHDAMVLGRLGVEALARGEAAGFHREHERRLAKVKAAG
jgi:protoporphyrinogen oxidase